MVAAVWAVRLERCAEQGDNVLDERDPPRFALQGWPVAPF